MPKLSAAILALALAACSGPDESIPIDAPVVVDATPSIDAPLIDAAMIDADDRCAACGVDEICVQYFNGTCGDGHVACETRGAGCTGTTCSADCQFWHCGGQDAGIYTCSAAPCGGEAPAALHCYGP